MALPLLYNWRSLSRRPTRALLTALGIGLAVFVSVLMLALATGLSRSIRQTGHPLNVLVLTRGAETMEFSALDRRVLDPLRFSAHVAERDGQRLASPEVYFTSLVQVAGRADTAQGLIRGVLLPAALAMHEQVRVTEGRWPGAPGEIMAGPLAATKLGAGEADVAVGRTLRFEGAEWRVVGRFAAPGTAFESEIWGPLDDLMVAARRTELSAVVLRARDAAALDELLFDFDTRSDVLVQARRETDYYAAYAASFRPVQTMVYAMTGMLVLGGVFIGMNTLFAAVAGRVREVGVLRTLGFKRADILFALFLEALAPAVAGGAVASLLALGLNGLALRIPMGAFRFQVDAPLVGAGILLSLGIGLLGAAWPLLRASQIKVVDAIRHL